MGNEKPVAEIRAEIRFTPPWRLPADVNLYDFLRQPECATARASDGRKLCTPFQNEIDEIAVAARLSQSPSGLRLIRDKFNASKELRRIRLAHARFHGVHSFSQWIELCAEFDFCCVRCGRGDTECPLEKDHIVLIARGGSDAISNIQPICARCNCSKGLEFVDYVALRRSL